MSAVPRYANLPGGRADGVFGADDVVGSLNRITPDVIVGAASLVREGIVVSVNAPLDWPETPLFNRNLPTRHPYSTPSGYNDDYWDALYPQASSQWDALRHVPGADRRFYNDRPPEEIGVEVWGRRGIVGRSLLLDVERHLAGQGQAIPWNDRFEVDRAMLEACAAAQGSPISPGDILLVRLGWQSGYEAATPEEQQRAARELRFPGLAPSPEIAELLWDGGVAAVASDCPALEAWPPPSVPLHQLLVPALGIALGELWWLDELAATCVRLRRWEGLLTSAPLNAPCGAGSPANTLVLL